MGSVFYSWQSDLPRKVTRDIIADALDFAISALKVEFASADRPDGEEIELDSDTQGVPGTPDIFPTILLKIEQASAFVADVTAVTTVEGKRGRTKLIPNPNVLIELGYARKALTSAKIIQVWNLAFVDGGPEDLPFDLRGSRGPIAFNLPIEADKAQRDVTVAKLGKRLKVAIEAIIASDRPAPPRPKWAQHAEGDPSIWPIKDGVMTVNESGHGSGTKRVFPPPRSYVRILPNNWLGLDDSEVHDLLLGSPGGFSWGSVSGGVLTYPGSILFKDSEKVQTVTKRFSSTGELWATNTGIIRKWDEFLCIFGDDVVKEWAHYLAYAIPHLVGMGAELPFHIKIGVHGIGSCHWPNVGGTLGNPNAALENSFMYEGQVGELAAPAVWKTVFEAWKGYRNVFSLPEPSMQDQQSARMFVNKVIGGGLGA